MAARNKHETFPAIIVKMHKLLAWHPSEKGIIHCHTQELSKLLRNAFRKESRLIFYDNGDTEAKDEALRKHCESAQPTVLVAQSMQEGLNLRDDLSRFQAILKIPFPYLGDEGRQRGQLQRCPIHNSHGREHVIHLLTSCSLDQCAYELGRVGLCYGIVCVPHPDEGMFWFRGEWRVAGFSLDSLPPLTPGILIRATTR
jgi:hypothetical protein